VSTAVTLGIAALGIAALGNAATFVTFVTDHGASTAEPIAGVKVNGAKTGATCANLSNAYEGLSDFDVKDTYEMRDY
jgi:hypothetical protein